MTGTRPAADDAAPGTRLWLVRHGHTEWTESGRVAGRTDVALSERGREAVRTLGPTLGAELAAARTAGRHALWWTSPASRARETAALLLEGAGASGGGSVPAPREDARLVELDFGDWEGSTWEAVHRDHGERLARWGEDWVDGAPPNGESFRAQAARASAWLDDALAAGREAGGQSACDLFAIAHGGTIRALLAVALGHALERAMRFRVDPAGVACAERVAGTDGGPGRWLLRLSNAAGFDLTPDA